MTKVRTVEGTTAAVAPFDFGKTLDFLRGFPPVLGRLPVVGDGLYWASRVTGRTVLFDVRSNRGAPDGVLDYSLHIGGPGETEGVEQDAVWQLRRLLSLDDDLGDFYGLAQNDPCFAPVVRELYGLHSLRRGEYILDTARAFASVTPDFLQCAPDAELEEWLRGIRGIGPWSARFIMLRALGRYQGLPENERGLTRAASLVYGAGVTLTPQDVKRISNEYGRWRGYWAHYLRVWAQNRDAPRGL